MDNPPKLSHASLEQLLIAVCNLKVDAGNGKELAVALRPLDVLQPWVLQQARVHGEIPAGLSELLDKMYGPAPSAR